MSELAVQLHPTLTVIVNLFEAFHENDIRYCHWKSNEHLAASMVAETDLDVLFDEKQKDQIELIVKDHQFKRFDAIKQKQYKDIVDFIGFDIESCKVIHLHTHYRLTVGEPYLKGYQPNWEERILNGRVWDESFGIYCIEPAFELILLFVREALKIRHRDVIRMHLKNTIHDHENTVREYHWLKTRTSDQEINAILKTIFNQPAPIYALITGLFNHKQLQKLATLLKIELAGQRLYPKWEALFLRWYREASVISAKKLAHLLNRPILSKRVNPRGGIVVALIGADESDKSTIVNNLKKTFEEKLDVYAIHFRDDDGKKRKYLKLMRAAKKKGMLVICDGYPSNQVIQPDLVFKLLADEVGKRKSGETSIQKPKAKIAAIKQLQFNETCRVIEVDTDQPLQDVLSIITQEIWNAL
jgi:hypothetical protein